MPRAAWAGGRAMYAKRFPQQGHRPVIRELLGALICFMYGRSFLPKWIRVCTRFCELTPKSPHVAQKLSYRNWVDLCQGFQRIRALFNVEPHGRVRGFDGRVPLPNETSIHEQEATDVRANRKMFAGVESSIEGGSCETGCPPHRGWPCHREVGES